jgi:transposase-like protein
MNLRSYDKEFKTNAAKLYLNSGRSYRDVSEELGIPGSTLAQWVISYQKSGVEAFPGKGYLKPEDAELARLRKELAIAKEERDILKKALGIFSLPKK